MNILILDNYDSFTYNLVHLFEHFTNNVEVWRNDEIEFDRVSNFDAIVLSPGPGIPKEAGQMMELISKFIAVKPMLGVCLGCQALGEYFGAKLYNMKSVKHGLQTSINIEDHSLLYQGISQNIDVGRYHSWALHISKDLDLIPTAFDHEKILMSFRHRSLDVCGIQYHPESIMTPLGKDIIRNWVYSIKNKNNA